MTMQEIKQAAQDVMTKVERDHGHVSALGLAGTALGTAYSLAEVAIHLADAAYLLRGMDGFSIDGATLEIKAERYMYQAQGKLQAAIDFLG